jgi:hypothetical protein
MLLNFSSVCRLCLTTGKNEEAMVPLFIEDQEEENNLSLSSKVMALASVERVSCPCNYYRIIIGGKCL